MHPTLSRMFCALSVHQVILPSPCLHTLAFSPILPLPFRSLAPLPPLSKASLPTKALSRDVAPPHSFVLTHHRSDHYVNPPIPSLPSRCLLPSFPPLPFRSPPAITSCHLVPSAVAALLCSAPFVPSLFKGFPLRVDISLASAISPPCV